jgi:hypothetical protein
MEEVPKGQMSFPDPIMPRLIAYVMPRLIAVGHLPQEI